MVVVWSIFLAVITAGVLSGAIFVWLMKTQRAPAAEKSPVKVRVASRFPSPGKNEAFALVEHALGVRDPAAMEKYFRLEGTPPAEALGILRDLNRTDGPVIAHKWLGSLDFNGMFIDSVIIHHQTADAMPSRLVMMTPDETGVWKVDFHSFARTNVPTWDEILKADCKTGRVRVLLSRDNYFNRFFSDEAVWACYSLRTEDSNDYLLGYCRVGSPQHTAINRILRRIKAADTIGLRDVVLRPHATLEIRRVENSETRQVEITRVLAEGWVMSNASGIGPDYAPTDPDERN